MAEYIEREKIKFHRTGFEERCHNDVWTEYADIAYKSEIDSIPAADVCPVVRGKWIFYDSFAWKCSHCGWLNYHNMGVPNAHNFCPNCGALME